MENKFYCCKTENNEQKCKSQCKFCKDFVNEAKELTKPKMELYGYHISNHFDDEPTGWLIEGGEEAYYEALKKWNENNK